MEREIPGTNEIKMFFHCKKCFSEKPDDVTPREWVHIEAGFTPLGVQVWCRRCDVNIVHIDFQGRQLPANVRANA